MSICSDCEFYDEIDNDTGKCKFSSRERHVVVSPGHERDIINDWPVTVGTEQACGKFEPKI